MNFHLLFFVLMNNSLYTQQKTQVLNDNYKIYKIIAIKKNNAQNVNDSSV